MSGKIPSGSCRAGAPVVFISQQRLPIPAKLDISTREQGEENICIIKVRGMKCIVMECNVLQCNLMRCHVMQCHVMLWLDISTREQGEENIYIIKVRPLLLQTR
jgi:hypothetical protein